MVSLGSRRAGGAEACDGRSTGSPLSSRIYLRIQSEQDVGKGNELERNEVCALLPLTRGLGVVRHAGQGKSRALRSEPPVHLLCAGKGDAGGDCSGASNEQ